MLENNPREALAMLSHEMRTPLQSIEMICDLITTNPDQPISTVLEKFDSIRQTCRTLSHLLDEADQARHHTPQRGRFLQENVDLKALASFLREQITPLAVKLDRTLTIRVDRFVPRSLYTHPVWLEQIIRNLLIN